MKSAEQAVGSSGERLAFVALGSNLGDSRRIILDAIDRLQPFSTSPLLRSSLWESTPVDCPPGSPRFVNAVVGLKPRREETPETLLAKIHQIEQDFGRGERKVRNEPRRLDLDLLIFGGERRASPALTLPHPRAHLRRFVLQPLAEIAPDFVIPGLGRTVAELLNSLKSSEILRRID